MQVNRVETSMVVGFSCIPASVIVSGSMVASSSETGLPSVLAHSMIRGFNSPSTSL